MNHPVPSGRRWPVTVTGLAVAIAAMAAMLWYGGAARQEPLPGLPHPGMFTIWALPVARLGVQVFSVATVGLLLAALVLSPRDGAGLSAVGFRRLRAASWTALGWSLSAFATLCYTLSDLLGAPLPEVLSLTSLVTFISSVNVGQSFCLTTLLALVVSRDLPDQHPAGRRHDRVPRRPAGRRTSDLHRARRLRQRPPSSPSPGCCSTSSR